jgi:hypothetical protein
MVERTMENLTCLHCGEHQAHFVKENPPYSLEHFRCNACESTFGYSMYQQEFETKLFKLITSKVHKSCKPFYEIYGKAYIKQLLDQEASPVKLIKKDTIILKDATNGLNN